MYSIISVLRLNTCFWVVLTTIIIIINDNDYFSLLHAPFFIYCERPQRICVVHRSCISYLSWLLAMVSLPFLFFWIDIVQYTNLSYFYLFGQWWHRQAGSVSETVNALLGFDTRPVAQGAEASPLDCLLARIRIKLLLLEEINVFLCNTNIINEFDTYYTSNVRMSV